MNEVDRMGDIRRYLIAYPFPFRGVEGTLRMPNDGLDREEADRLKDYIESLVTRPAADCEGAVEAVTLAVVMLGGLDEPWDALDYPERCARAENELRALLDRAGGQQ